jgi:hypothetical protein
VIHQPGVRVASELVTRALARRTVHETDFGAMAPFTAPEFQQRRDNLGPNAPLLATNLCMSRQHGDLPQF